MPRKLLRRLLPDPQRIREHRLLKKLGPTLHHPRLWHVTRNGIALGSAVGVFFGVLLPVAQIPAAVLFSIFVRANLPMAVAGTFITNPFTFAPVYYLAYQLGAWMLGHQEFEQAAPLFNQVDSVTWVTHWLQRLQSLGKPLLIGLPTLALISSLLSYVSINWLWRAHTVHAWNRRRAQRPADTP